MVKLKTSQHENRNQKDKMEPTRRKWEERRNCINQGWHMKWTSSYALINSFLSRGHDKTT